MKKMLLPLFIFSIFCFGFTTVSARECKYGLQAPQLPQGYAFNKGHLVKLKTTASACKGTNTAVYFSNFGSLPSWFVPTGGTIVNADLNEEDPAEYKPDELVKVYAGLFSGRVLTDFQLLRTVTPGNIDSEGDQTCELYMSFNIAGNGTQPVPQGLFYYSICMD